MKIFTLLLAALLATANFEYTSCTTTTAYEAINAAVGTPGGNRFQKEIGLDYAVDVLQYSSSAFWDVFGQSTDADRKNITLIVLTILTMNGIVTNNNNSILMSADYIGNFPGDVRTEFTGIVYHEMARVRQWDGHGLAPIGLLTGIADFFRLKAGYASARWVRSGEGFRWDEGYDVTARFLDYCNDMYVGLVAHLNAMMETRYSSLFFVQLTGKSVDELWNDYKVHYGG